MAVARPSRCRLRPIVMTSMAFIFGRHPPGHRGRRRLGQPNAIGTGVTGAR
jgi:multidrug efflux pump subunit AcrB